MKSKEGVRSSQHKHNILYLSLGEALCFLGILIVLSVCSVTVLAAVTDDEAIESESSRVTTETAISTSTSAAAVQADVRTTEEPQERNFVSTACLVAQGKEEMKGDRGEAYLRKIRKEKRRKRLEKQRRLAQEKAKKQAYNLSMRKWLKTLNTQENIEKMAHLAYAEAGDQGDECMQAVILTFLNRLRCKDFSEVTIDQLLSNPRAYACLSDGGFQKTPSKDAYKCARKVLSGNGIYVPEDVVYQAQFTQGSGVWRKIGTEIFCHL